jgi:glucans biosynthesis protein
VETSVQNASVLRRFVVPNIAIKGLRVMLDVQFEKDKVGTVSAALRSAGRALTETWTFSWRFYDL